MEALLDTVDLSEEARQRIKINAKQLVTDVRNQSRTVGGLNAFLQQYDLSSEEGVVLLCLAEALLRIPDSETADRLIRDKLSKTHWEKHLGKSDSLFVNAGTWGLMLTGRMTRLSHLPEKDVSSFLLGLVTRLSDPVVRTALKEAMRIMAFQFVMGRNIEEAVKRSQSDKNKIYSYSFDMLGEAALCQTDADHYYEIYQHAIQVLGSSVGEKVPLRLAPSISIKLSALHPRFEYSQRQRLKRELVPIVTSLAVAASNANITMTIDAEESDRLDLTLDIFEAVFSQSQFDTWSGLGIVVQTYQKRAPDVIEWLIELSKHYGRSIFVRLVKGAYWDTEIKRAQERGLSGYPVFTRKVHTDVSYLACVQQIAAARDFLSPQFATHNAHTLAAVLEITKGRKVEMQRLHGMGDSLYEHALAKDQHSIHCRVYAPVGAHKDLLPYLVRRLLENGANTSFVNRITDANAQIDDVVRDPVTQVENSKKLPHEAIPLPRNLFGHTRINSNGILLDDATSVNALMSGLKQFADYRWSAAPMASGKIGALNSSLNKKEITHPADKNRVIGDVSLADETMIDDVINASVNAGAKWNNVGVVKRAQCLNTMAEHLESHGHELVALCNQEGGRCIVDALSEVREAVDFCRYYAVTATELMAQAQQLVGPTGEHNELLLAGRGVFVCISPWNFPLAIFTGQIAAALVTGNCVIAKPASQTPLIGCRVVELFYEAGIPRDVLQFLTGNGATIAVGLISDSRISGVAFTGSTETAQSINLNLAKRSGPIVPLIAETGGQNAMIVDSSALPEQVIQDVLSSAFNSAGQRCSALRLLYVQEEIAPRIIELLQGAMAELTIGDPGILSTDVGPLIDNNARDKVQKHIKKLDKEAELIFQLSVPSELNNGLFVGPCAYEIKDASLLKREVFGPVLHLIRYDSQSLDKVITAINDTGYGLTLGIHTRVESTAKYIQNRVHVGNVYVNRNMVGAVVGVQPFGGQGLSGTGPKSGGPNYLARFVNEQVISTNTSAIGGNASLMTMDDN